MVESQFVNFVIYDEEMCIPVRQFQPSGERRIDTQQMSFIRWRLCRTIRTGWSPNGEHKKGTDPT
jgi:hypothetical protein